MKNVLEIPGNNATTASPKLGQELVQLMLFPGREDFSAEFRGEGQSVKLEDHGSG